MATRLTRKHLLVAVLSVTAALAAAVPAASARPAGANVKVIVLARPGATAGVLREVRVLGGRIDERLALVHGLSVTISRAAAAALRSAPGVLSVTPNARIAPQSDTYDAGGDVNSMASTADFLGADSWWEAGYTGAGIDVAVIDSGVSPVEGLNTPGKVVYGPDLSLESQAPNLTNLDTFGHGTFMAGLIAGHDPDLAAPYDDAPASQYRGIAPDARIVSIKVATADGGTDVSQVIAAIDWVVQHAHDPGFNMRVINLSYGTNSTQSYRYDPLAYAAEQAWRHGIVVVAAAGNRGGDPSISLSDPAYDPTIIAAGASDSMGTANQGDDVVSAFSSYAKSWYARSPDLVAPGAHLQGLRVPNSYIDVNHDSARLGDRFFRGSGTSQAAAITSGAAALILQRYPYASPDQVKSLLRSGSLYLPLVGNSRKMGSGELQLNTAFSRMLPSTAQNYYQAQGTGSLEQARGSDHLTRDGVVLTGEQDIMGSPFASGAMAQLESQGKSWSGGAWNGKSWSGDTWSGNSWSGISWSGNSWSGVSWTADAWSGNSWSGNSWSTTDWSGNSWSGNSWSGDDWATGCWC